VMELADRLFAEALEAVAQGRAGADYKTRLQEEAQLKLKQAPRYRVVAESGPEHAKQFEVEVTIGTTPYARASGRNKKEAEQAAARETLRRLSESESDS
jgi:ribonuclease-3